MNVRLLAVLFSVALVGSIEHARADLVFVGGSRDVTALVTHGAPDSGGTAAPGPYFDTATSSGAGLAGGFTAHASQSSTTPALTAPGMFGSGGASTSLTATGMGGYGTDANSNFLVNFMVDVDGLYSFDAMVHWTGDVPPFVAPNSESFVQLLDVTNSIVLAYTFNTFLVQGTSGVSGTFPLLAANTYQVTAHAGIGGGGAIPGAFDADSGWSFDLAAASVPEAGSVAMMVVGSLLAAAIAWWKGKK
jgi:hypothetical protein